MMRPTSRSDDERHWLPVALIFVAVTFGLLAAGCSGFGASTGTAQTGCQFDCGNRQDQLDRRDRWRRPPRPGAGG